MEINVYVCKLNIRIWTLSLVLLNGSMNENSYIVGAGS